LSWGEFKLQEGASFSDEFHTFGILWTEDGLYTYIDSDENKIMTLNFTSNSSEKAGESSESGESPLWQKGDFPSSMSNPWRSGDDSAPFDERFYISIAVAVGGVSSCLHTYLYVQQLAVVTFSTA
jgi:hypothetical protein